MRVCFSWIVAMTVLVSAGCGGGEVDKPAELTADEEQKILEQVESAAQSEAGQPGP